MSAPTAKDYEHDLDVITKAARLRESPDGFKALTVDGRRALDAVLLLRRAVAEQREQDFTPPRRPGGAA